MAAPADPAYDQIVVESEHLALLGQALGDRRVQPVATSAALGLTLLDLTDPAGARDALIAAGSTRKDGSALDDVLGGLRDVFAGRYAGWFPTMGKNRTLTGVQFKPYSNGGGFNRPTATGTGQIAAPTGKGRVRVGLLDARLVEHSALTGRYTVAPDAVAGPADPEHPRAWWEGHATFIAGLILKEAPDAYLDVRTALQRADKDWTMPLWRFAEELEELRRSGVRVVNVSMGATVAPSAGQAQYDGRAPLVLERAIGRLTTDMVVVAAAGNHGTAALTDEERRREGLPVRNAVLYPAALDGVLAVGALDGNGKSAEFNPRGVGEEVAPWIDVFAPGVEIPSTYLGDPVPEQVNVPADDGEPAGPREFKGWAQWSGTSFATGTVTGEIAALLGAGKSAEEAVAVIRKKYARPT